MTKENISLQLEIYDRIIKHFMFQYQIAKDLNIKPKTVSKYVKIIRDKKIIEDAYPESTEAYYKSRGKRLHQIPAVNIRSNRYRCYKKGPNAYIFDEMLKKGKTTIEKRNIRPHHERWKFKIEGRTQNPIPIIKKWETHWKFGNTNAKTGQIDFKDYGKVRIFWYNILDSKNREVYETIVICLPSNHYYYDSYEAEKDRGDKFYAIWQHFSKCGYSISSPKLCSPPYYGIDTGIEGKGFGRTELDEDSHLDTSPGTVEFETKNKDVANTFSNLPKTILNINQNIESLRQEIHHDNERVIEILKEVKDGFDNGINRLIEDRKNSTIYRSKKSKEEGYGYQ